MKQIFFIIVCLFLLGINTLAVALEKTSDWTDIAFSSDKQAKNDVLSRWLKLNADHLLARLAIAPDEGENQQQARQVAVEIELPLPTGEMVLVRAKKSPIMASSLAEKYPDLQTWKVYGEANILSGRIDFTPSGFHAILSLSNGETVFIDPEDIEGARYYVAKQRSRQQDSSHQCHLQPAVSAPQQSEHLQRSLARGEAVSLQTYRLAVATTAEYTQFFGGTVAKGLAAVVTTINRVNEIYERDLAIRLILVAENNQIIYTDRFSDPYTNQSANQSSDQNQVNLDRVIGSNHYDIGHVFGTSAGGIAVVDAACNDKTKAIAATGLSSPNSDVFYIDFVSHEIGHQLGADHTFSSDTRSCKGQRSDTVAYEVGSGSTIMAYAGICGSDNLQNNSDAAFHSASIQQITQYTREEKGSFCAKTKVLSNRKPEASTGDNYTIPARTPFILTAKATDEDNDTLTYAWDQMDMGDIAALDVDNGKNGIIRSYLPTTSAQRVIPKLSDLLAGTHTIGENLPTTSRKLTFNVVVRDGKSGVGMAGIQLQVHDTGVAFAVKEPDASAIVKRNEGLAVAWEVANTTRSPVNCSKVNIELSTDGGQQFTTILEKTSNDGSETVIIPATAKENTTSRLKVSCSNNIFFALSPANFTIQGTGDKPITPPTPTASGGLVLPQLMLLFLILVVRRFYLSHHNRITMRGTSKV